MFQLLEITTDQMANLISRSPKRHHVVCCAWIGFTLAGSIANEIGILDDYRHFLYYAADSANNRKKTTNLHPIAKLSLLPVDTSVSAAMHANYMQEIIALTIEETEENVRGVFEHNELTIHSEVIYFYLENGYCNYERIREILISLENDGDFQAKHPTVRKVYLSCLVLP